VKTSLSIPPAPDGRLLEPAQPELNPIKEYRAIARQSMQSEQHPFASIARAMPWLQPRTAAARTLDASAIVALCGMRISCEALPKSAAKPLDRFENRSPSIRQQPVNAAIQTPSRGSPAGVLLTHIPA
jgi:hypothetical protein